MIYITYTDPKTKNKQSTQIVRPLVIGRTPDADVYIDSDSTISKIHALVIPRSDGRIELRDLASKAGTYVVQRGEKRRLIATTEKSGEEKGRATLFDGENFFVGATEITVHYEEVLGEPTLDQNYSLDWDDVTGEEKIF